MDLKQLIVDLQSLGVQMPKPLPSRRGGAGPAEGTTIILHGWCCNVPTASWYVASSPYQMRAVPDGYRLYHHDLLVGEINIPPRPQYYDLVTPDGTRLEHIALMHGSDCLASTVYQDCIYWNTPHQCRFCGIGLSLKQGLTTLSKSPADLARAAESAYRTDNARHVTLTTGAWQDEKAGAAHLAACVQAIKHAAPLPVHVQLCPPQRLDLIDLLKQAGADSIGIHLDVPDETARQRLAPGKALVSVEAYRRCWEHAVSVFGKNQVSSFLIAGLGEDFETMTACIELLCSSGVFPYVVPFRPIPGTPLSTARPPAPELMRELYTRTARILKNYGLASAASKAGCVRCGACSALALFEHTEEHCQEIRYTDF